MLKCLSRDHKIHVIKERAYYLLAILLDPWYIDEMIDHLPLIAAFFDGYRVLPDVPPLL